MAVDGPASQPVTLNPYDRVVSKTQQRRRLLSVHWELTYRCNERCTHCYLDVFAPNAKVPGELTTDECLRIIGELSAAGALNLTFSGGEILVRQDFFELANYARQKRLLLRLYTNGLLIKPAVADRIASLHPYAVEISLYGADAETHERITRLRRSFELTVRAFRLLHERGVRTVMKTPLMHENVHQIHALEALAEELGARFRYDTTITPKDTGGTAPLRHRMTHDDLLWLYREQLDPELFIGRTVNDQTRTCGITQNALAIDPYGNVLPCLQTRVAAGNVRYQSVQDIWQNSPVWQELGNLTLSQLPVCRTCELNTLCVRCHGLARLEDGDLHGPALTNCREALVRRQVLIEKGTLPVDYPIPAHLKTYAANARSDAQWTVQPHSTFIPLSAVAVGH